jgi:hypothetical protein
VNGQFTAKHPHVVRIAFGPKEMKVQVWSFKQGDGREYYVELVLPDGSKAVVSFAVSRDDAERSLR